MNASNVFNIEASLNQWIRTQLDTYTTPAFFSGFGGSQRVVFNMPEAALSAPCFSVDHLFIETMDLWQGRLGDGGTTAQKYSAFLDVNIWVTRSNNNWAIDKRWMASILSDLMNKTKSISLTDYLTTYPTSSAAGYLVYIDAIEARQVGDDPNPDLVRERFLIKYHTNLRSN
jgi:hypothetical protein